MLRSFLLILASTLLLVGTVSAQGLVENFKVRVVIAEESPPLPGCTAQTFLNYYLSTSIATNSAAFFGVNEKDISMKDLMGSINPKSNNLRRALQGTFDDESRRLAIYSYKTVFSGTGAYTCRLCSTDSLDRRQLVDKTSYDAYMSKAVSKDLDFINKVNMMTLAEGKPTCLGSGKVPIQVIFTSTN
jgi:hypothetical protein